MAMLDGHCSAVAGGVFGCSVRELLELWPDQLPYHLNSREKHTGDAEEGSNVGG